MTFTERALVEIDGLHRVLQAWFRADGEQDPTLVLSHFDPGYTMITTGGTMIGLENLKGGLTAMWGSRPGLVMAITQKALVHASPDAALMTYVERQHLNGAYTDRFSTVLMMDRGESAPPAWQHLQETMMP